MDFLNNSSVIVQVSKEDLMSVVKELVHELTSAKSSRESEEYLTPDVTAERLHISLPTLWRWCKQGIIEKVKINKKVLFRSTDIDKLLQANG